MSRKRFLLRLDPRLYTVLERWASDEFRSVNGQIEHLLAEAARRADRWRERDRQADQPDVDDGEPDETDLD